MPPRAWYAIKITPVVLSLLIWPALFAGYTKGHLDAVVSLGSLGTGWLMIFSLIVLTIASVPPLAAPVFRLLQLIQRKTQCRAELSAIFAALIATGYLSLTAVSQHRQLFPYLHDEFSYLIQARQLAGGRLWMPAHPLGDFFDSFQLLVQPVYASAYFPGTAILYVPGVWFHLPAYVTSLVIAGVIAGQLLWISTRLLNGLAGWLSLLLLLCDGMYRQLSTMTLGQLPLLLYSLAAVIAWLRWRETNRNRAATLIGIFLGLAAITRPVDSLCFAIPITVSVLLNRKWKAIGLMLAGAAPLLILQLIANHGITGSIWRTPFNLYADQDYPGTRYGFHAAQARAAPASKLLQKQMLYDSYRATIEHHQPADIPANLRWHLFQSIGQKAPVPYLMLSCLCPLALLAMNRRRAVLLASLPLFLLLYGFYVFFFPHYVMTAAPAVILAVLLGAVGLIEISGRFVRLLTVATTLFIAGTAIASLPQASEQTDDAFNAPLLSKINQQLANLPHQPAVVLFKFDPGRNLDEEPVYNADVAWPDEATTIRAHDLGVENQRLFDYYTRHQPRRWIYGLDERTGTVELLKRPQR